MVETRARAKGAPPPPPALTKEQKAAARTIKAKEKAAEKARKDQEKAAAKAVKAKEKVRKDQEKAAAKAAKAPKATKATKAAKGRQLKTPRPNRAKNIKSTKTLPDPAYSESKSSDEDLQGEDEKQTYRKRRRIASSSSHAYVEVKVSRPEPLRINFKEWDYSRELPPPEGLHTKLQGTLPTISVGGSAPQPRWLVGQNKFMPQPPMYLSYTDSKRKASSGSSSSDYGKLIWYLDEGDFNLWGGLTHPQLEELAHICFENALNRPVLIDDILHSLSDGPLPQSITSSEAWYPILPPPPCTRYFAKSSDMAVWESPEDPHDSGYYYKDYERPSLAVQQPRSAQRSHQHILATKLLDQIATPSDASIADSDMESPVSPTALESLMIEQTDKNSVETSGVSYNSEDDSQLESNLAHESQEQSPDSAFSNYSSDGEVSAPSNTSAPQLDDAKDVSADSTNSSKISSSVSSHYGLFSANQIDEYYNKSKQARFHQDKLAGRELPEKRKFQREAEEERKRARGIRNGTQAEEENTQTRDRPLQWMEGPYVEGEEDEESTCTNEPLGILDLRDPFLEQAKEICLDRKARRRYFPDPIVVHRARMWAGEDLNKQDAKPNVDAALPPWADTHRPFGQWQDPAQPAEPTTTRSRKKVNPACKRVTGKHRALSDSNFSSF